MLGIVIMIKCKISKQIKTITLITFGIFILINMEIRRVLLFFSKILLTNMFEEIYVTAKL